MINSTLRQYCWACSYFEDMFLICINTQCDWHFLSFSQYDHNLITDFKISFIWNLGIISCLYKCLKVFFFYSWFPRLNKFSKFEFLRFLTFGINPIEFLRQSEQTVWRSQYNLIMIFPHQLIQNLFKITLFLSINILI